MKVGDYVRIINTLEGYNEIIKIKELNEYDGYLLDERDYQYSTDEIINSSPNIIDLIEIGDILYLEESDDIACMFFKDIYLVKNEDNLLNIISDIKNKKCKLISIVTKEQFENIKYKVGE